MPVVGGSSGECEALAARGLECRAANVRYVAIAWMRVDDFDGEAASGEICPADRDIGKRALRFHASTLTRVG